MGHRAERSDAGTRRRGEKSEKGKGRGQQAESSPSASSPRLRTGQLGQVGSQ
jgi:hypothetical protein